jgi:dTDP-4-amino-4,6-dideoxygalactose transaminase
VLPPLVEGATYSHYPVRVPDRQAAVDHFARHGVHLGEVVEYSVAHLKAYTGYAAGAEFPNSLYCSGHMVNLPIHPQLSDGDADRVIAVARKIR